MATRLQAQLDVADAELHLFGYLSCLLSLYSGVSGLGVYLCGPKNGSPFSDEIQNAVTDLLLNGCLSE